ncbi:hypothetical protein FB567DRAFT_552340 [Paraphoma chrysanthemicola]|uniref:Uncharacterized protein n=1 Tax=Paraphoma chrysanthemicola TaxID=798071 RepID=A0A8K0VVI6_9PLEO|nr:hypothetical protein FB567DRAFT_552340 [Paraphoma chrysanthemicola]
MSQGEFLDTQHLRQRFEDSSDAVKQKIDCLIGATDPENPAAALLLQLYGQMFEPNSIGAVLALTFCFAHNLEYIDISEMPHVDLKSVWDALSLDWRQISPSPFSRLKVVYTIGCAEFFEPVPVILPSMVSLSISNTDFGGDHGSNLYPFHHPIPITEACTEPALERIHLSCVSMLTPAFVRSMASSPWLRNLKVLSINYPGPCEQSSHLPLLLRALENYTRSLEVFEWYNTRRLVRASTFDTFKNLKCLRILHTDLSLLCPASDINFEVSGHLDEVLPEQLDELTIHEVVCDRLDEAMRQFKKTCEDLGDQSTFDMKTLAFWRSKVPFKRLALVVEVETVGIIPPHEVQTFQLDPSTLYALQGAANRLYGMGMILEVIRPRCNSQAEAILVSRHH